MTYWPDVLCSRVEETVEAARIDELIEATFGRPWSCQQNGEYGNDSITWFECYKDPEATEAVQAWLDSPPAKGPGRLHQEGYAESYEIYTYVLLSELCNRGILPEGDMRVHVWW